MGRHVPPSTLVRAQADFYSDLDAKVRAVGVSTGDVSIAVFLNNVPVSWPLEDGGSISDSSVSAGRVLMHEISGSPGYYSVRFFPDRIGFWRIVLRNATLLQESVVEVDVASWGSPTQAGGLNASFTKS